MKKPGKFSSIKIAAAANTLILVMLVSLSLFTLVPLADETTASADGGPVYSAASDDKISLMFNVYQGEEFVLDALDLLDGYGAKCTFFVGGCWADDHVDVLREIYARGHELGNHGYFHKDHKGMSQKGNLAEIEPTNALIEAVTGASPALFAPHVEPRHDRLARPKRSGHLHSRDKGTQRRRTHPRAPDKGDSRGAAGDIAIHRQRGLERGNRHRIAHGVTAAPCA